MFAVVNKFGVVVGFATKNLGVSGFQYIEASEEIIKAIRAKKSIKYIDDAFEIVEPFRSKTWEQIRKIRDVKFLEADAELYKKTDKERIDSLDLTDQKKSISLYRQALRDITETFDSADDVVFPIPPF